MIKAFQSQCIGLASVVCLVLVAGCASTPISESWKKSQTTALQKQLLELDHSVAVTEAARLAETAVEQSAELAREYRAVRPAWFNNVLVNCGLHQRGLCYEWVDDLFPCFVRLELQSLELHEAVAHKGTLLEHNCIVITAYQQPFAQGVVLDAWRHSGRLWFGTVASDGFPWKPIPRADTPTEPKKISSQ